MIKYNSPPTRIGKKGKGKRRKDDKLGVRIKTLVFPLSKMSTLL